MQGDPPSHPGSGPGQEVRAAAADLAAVVERLSADLGLPEEPSGFLAALEGETDEA